MRERPESSLAASRWRGAFLRRAGAWLRPRASVAAKFNLVFVSLLVAMALALGSTVARQGLRSDREAVLRFATAYARPVIERGQQAIHGRDPEALGRLLEQLLLVPDAAYVRVLDAQGAELVGAVRRPDLEIPDPAGEGGLPRVGPRITSLENASGELHRDVLLPVAASGGLLARLEPGSQVPTVIGWVQLGLDDHWARERRASFLLATVALVSTLAILAAAATVLIVRWLARPIRRLAEVAREVAEGHFDQRLDARSRDEVGELARSLDVMLQRLRDYREQVENYQRNLETQVDERTLALQRRTQEALALAKEAQQANRAKTQFLANISHEIRTPMNGVLGMTELLLDSELSPPQRRFAATVHKSARLLLGLINDLLDFSRAEAGRLKLEPSDFDPGEAIEDVVEMLAEQAHARGIELAGFVDEELPRAVRGDPVRLRQILTNLLGNAIKFTERGEVVVRAVRVPTDGAPDDHRCRVQITVTDTGIGIPESARGSIFEAFQQADGSMARRFGGAGLGLAISKQLVELMGGSIAFETEPSRGSRFSVELCFEPAREGAPEPERAPRELCGARVLVADGHATSRRINAHRLRSWGAEVVEAESAQAALAALGEAGATFRVALLDPTTLGEESGALLRTLGAGGEAGPALLLLAPVGRPGATAALGTAKSVPKPTRERALRRALREALRPGAAADAPPAAPPPPCEREPLPVRVLLVEDNEVNRQVAEAMLRTLGCEVEVVADGRQALARAADRGFDLIFMDCQLPELDGFAATRAIREAEVAAGRPRVPIVALTAHAMRHDRDQCLRAGMDDYVSKPFEREALARQLEHWAPGRRVLRPARRATPAERAAPGPLAPAALRSLRVLEEQSAPDLVASVVEAYLVSSDELERELCDAVGTRDPERLARAAHKLKSSSAQIGAERLSALCKELEALGRAGLTEGSESLVADVGQELQQVQEALAAERFGVLDD